MGADYGDRRVMGSAPAPGLRDAVLLVPKIMVGGLVLFAIGVMLAGVFLRYVMIEVTDWMDVDPLSFFWVEEVGELALAWLTMVGAAVGVAERAHFTLTLLTHRLPPGAQRALHIFNNGLIASFGGLIAWQGWNLVKLNGGLTSPALEISLGWLYGATVVGGTLIALYALAAAAGPVQLGHRPEDVRE